LRSAGHSVREEQTDCTECEEEKWRFHVPANRARSAAISRREADALQQILETRVAAQTVPLRFALEKDHARLSLSIPPLEPRKRFIALAEAVMNHRDVVRRHVPLRRQLQELFEFGPRFRLGMKGTVIVGSPGA